MRNRAIRMTGPGPQILAQNEIRRPTRFEQLATISQPYANATIAAELPTGRYTYYGHQFAIVSSVDIPGATEQQGNDHWILTPDLATYVSSVQIEINGTVETELSATVWEQLNRYFAYGFGTGGVNGFLHLRHGSPQLYDNHLAMDTFAMGTANVESLRLIFKLTDQFNPATMQIRLFSEYAIAPRPIGFCNFFKSYYYTTGAIGKFTITDLPINADVARLFIFGEDVDAVKMEADTQLVFDAKARELTAMHELYGWQPDKLTNCVVWDFVRDRDHKKALRSMEAPELRRRQARIDLTLDMLTANKSLEIVVEQTGAYQNQN